MNNPQTFAISLIVSYALREIALIMNRVLMLTSVNYDQSVQPESVSQDATVTDDTRLDVECAVRELEIFPDEDRTLTRLIFVMKDDQARLALLSAQDNPHHRFLS